MNKIVFVVLWTSPSYSDELISVHATFKGAAKAAMKNHHKREPYPVSIPEIDVEVIPDCTHSDIVAVYGNTYVVARELKE